MDFKKFQSIENSYRQKEIQSIQINFPNEQFVVQEKIHGSNFSFWTDGKVVKCAKRSAFIKDDESFFGYEALLDTYEKHILYLFEELRTDKYLNEDLTELAIFGEIYGGTYPHPDVPRQNVSKVQGGVYYSPDVNFIAFDIKANGVYVDFKKFKTVCMVGKIPYLDAIASGTFEECLAVANEYPSTLPAMHGLPEIDGNGCEGNVIRPVNTLYFGNGKRVILKNKNEAFSEKKQGKKEPKVQVDVPKEIQDIQLEAVQYINDNRLRNVISKVGEVTQKDFGKLLGLLSKDVMDDLAKDFPKVLELDNVQRKMVTRLLNNECGNLIRPNFSNIIDGNY